MVNHGLDVEFHAVLEGVHWLIDGCEEERDGEDVVPALNFLVREAGMPPDTQVRPVRQKASSFGDKGGPDPKRSVPVSAGDVLANSRVSFAFIVSRCPPRRSAA